MPRRAGLGLIVALCLCCTPGQAAAGVTVRGIGPNQVEVTYGGCRFVYDGNGNHITHAMAGITDARRSSCWERDTLA